MSDVTTTSGRTKSETEILRTQLGALTPEFAAALPSHIRPEKFSRVVMTVCSMTPDLLAADRRSLLAATMKCAADGLVPDNREAALVIFSTKVKENGKEFWVKKVQYMPMLAGLQKRARNTGDVSSVEAHVIYENDKFVWRQGIDSTIIHEPLFPGDRGKPIGAYAIAKLRDGSTLFEVMDKNEIERVRSVSKSKDGPTWTTWWSEMARKSVFRRLCKWLPTSADIDEPEGDSVTALTDTQRRVIDASVAAQPHALESPASRLEALELLSGSEAVTVEGEVDDFPGKVTKDAA
jgi:recombination protein RecT